MTESTDLVIVGAGPCGLAAGIAARQAGVPCVLLDRRTIVSTIERYPLGMTFFSTPERIEIGGIPFIASHEKPTRKDGLIYYRRVAEHYGLDIRPGDVLVLYTDGVLDARGPDDRFGEDRLQQSLAGVTSADQAVDRIQSALLEFAGAEQDDDIAALAIQKL